MTRQSKLIEVSDYYKDMRRNGKLAKGCHFTDDIIKHTKKRAAFLPDTMNHESIFKIEFYNWKAVSSGFDEHNRTDRVIRATETLERQLGERWKIS